MHVKALLEIVLTSLKILRELLALRKDSENARHHQAMIKADISL